MPPLEMQPSTPRRTRAGGPKTRPTRYAATEIDDAARAALVPALRAHKKGAFDAAVAGYTRVLALSPDALDAWMNLGAAEVMRGRARAAHAAYGRAMALSPGDPRVLRDAGIGLVAIGRFTEARAALLRAVDAAPDLVGARLVLSRLSGELGDPEAAILHAEAAITHAPDDASSHVELCRAHFDDRALAPCIAAAERAVALDPGFVWAQFLLCAARAWAGRATEAELAMLPPHLADAIASALATRVAETRAFATKRDTLHHALAIATGDGPVIELGVRHGISTRVIAERVPGDFHAFDGFVGLPEAWDGRPAGIFATAGEPPDLPQHVSLHVGMFHDTLPPFAAALDRSPRMIHVDSDLYESARTALAALGPKIAPGCVLVFDEYFGNKTWRDDEHRAFAEAARAFGWRFAHAATSLFTGQVVLRIVAVGDRSVQG
jgi:tetratricopeptide (TPR) repeat protein